MIKTITIDTDKWRVVPIEPTRAMCAAALAFDDNKPLNDWGKIVAITYDETYSAMLAAAPLPEQIESEQISRMWSEVKELRAELAKYRDAPVVAYATTNEDGDLSMLFFDEQEVRKYSGDGGPIKLIVKPGETK